MIEVTDLFKEMAQKYYRNVDFKIVSNDDESTVYSGDVILECQINRSVGSSGIQIGNAISDRLRFTLKSTDKIKSGTRLTPYVRYKGEENTEWLRLGRFYCTESKMSNGIMTVTAYDRLYNFDKRCAFGGRDSIQALSFPATHQQMWDYVCALRGVESDFQCADFTVSERPLANPNAEDDSKYYTQRQIVGMIAACNAGNAVIDNNGKLTVRRFANQTYTLNKNRCFTQEIDTAEQFQVKGVLFHVDSENDIFIDDNASEYSEDREGIIVCDNALATVGVAEYVWNKLGNLKYSGCEITRRGVGWLETGETLQVEDFYDAEGGAVNVITSEIDYAFSYDNGFTETIRSVAETAEQSGNRAVASNSDTGAVATPSVEKFTNFVANSDGTYTYNGVTYGFETDEGTGYINKVYDDERTVDIDTENAAVNSGKVDFNTLILSVAIANGLSYVPNSEKTSVYEVEITADGGQINLMNENGTILLYNATIDWGDGSSEDYSTRKTYLHTYAKAGTYKISVTADLTTLWGGFQAKSNSILKSAKFANCVNVIGYIDGPYNGNFEYITLPKTITELHYNNFCTCKSLKMVYGLERITSVDDNCFYGCSFQDAEIIMPKCTSIGANAFYNTGIVKLDVPELTSIEEAALNSTKLKYFNAPKLTQLNKCMIYCSTLEEAHLEGLTSIKSAELYGKNFKLFVSTALKSIAQSAFSNSTVTIEYSGTQEQWDAIEKVEYWDSGATITLHCNG